MAFTSLDLILPFFFSSAKWLTCKESRPLINPRPAELLLITKVQPVCGDQPCDPGEAAGQRRSHELSGASL